MAKGNDMERFWSRVEKTVGCWLWLGRLDRYGRGRFSLGGRPALAHRVAYEFATGEVPAGTVIRACNNNRCVRPDHLLVAPQRTKKRTVAERFWEKVDKKNPDDCWPWTGYRNPGGYGMLNIENTPALAPRVSWALVNGEIPPGLKVCHRCDNPPCVNPAHLFLGTDADNVADMIAKGRRVIVSKVRPEQILAIISRVRAGASQRSVAADLGLSPSAISRIVARYR